MPLIPFGAILGAVSAGKGLWDAYKGRGGGGSRTPGINPNATAWIRPEPSSRRSAAGRRNFLDFNEYGGLTGIGGKQPDQIDWANILNKSGMIAGQGPDSPGYTNPKLEERLRKARDQGGAGGWKNILKNIFTQKGEFGREISTPALLAAQFGLGMLGDQSRSVQKSFEGTKLDPTATGEHAMNALFAAQDATNQYTGRDPEEDFSAKIGTIQPFERGPGASMPFARMGPEAFDPETEPYNTGADRAYSSTLVGGGNPIQPDPVENLLAAAMEGETQDGQGSKVQRRTLENA
jgi:hypothetical protein